MKTYKLQIPIGELFKFLQLDNDIYETFQKPDNVSRKINIKTINNEYVPINFFIKKKGYVRTYIFDGGSITCDEKHKIAQIDNSIKFIKTCNHVIVNGVPKKILTVSNREYKDVYDISLNYPNLYITSNGVVSHNTSAAKLIAKHLNCDFLYINASSENNVDTVRNKITNFVSTIGFKKWKIVILDESDFLTPNSLAALRNLMETFSKTARFILTCNYVEKIIEPIQSRCVAFHIIPPDKKAVAKRCLEILDSENIAYDKKDVATVINKSYPDMRRIINTLQSNSKSGSLSIDAQTTIEANYMEEILEVLKTFKTPKEAFITIRKIIADSKVRTFEDLYRFLYDHLDEFAPNAQAATILSIAKTMQADPLCVDKEIAVMAMFIEILTNLKE